jgi:hypothetical protein
MSRRGSFVLSILLVWGAAACATIIGDFTKGDEPPDASTGDGSRSDAPPVEGTSSGNPSDATSPTDVTQPPPSGDAGDAGDASDGARPPPPLLTCSFQPGSTALIANFARQANNTPDEIYFLGPAGTNQTAYIVVPGSPDFNTFQGADVYRYTTNQSSPNAIDIPAPQGQIYDAHRTSDGIVILAMNYGFDGHNQLVVYKLSQAVTDGGIPVWQTIPIGPQDPVPPNSCRQVASFLVVNSQTDDYIAALSYNPSPLGCSGDFGPPVLFVTRTGTAPDGGGSAPLVQFDVPLDGGSTLDIARDGIVLDPGTSKIYVFADPGGGSGPADGIGPIVFSSPDTLPAGGSTAKAMNLGTNSFASGMGYIYSPSTHNIDVGLLGGDLSLSAPSFFVGNAPSDSLATKSISSYPATVVTPVEALPVDKGRSHWHAFPSSGEHLLLIGRNDLKGGNGVNIFWFDQSGTARVRQAATDGGPDHSALLQNKVVVGADITFAGAPTGSPAVVGNLLIAVTEQTGSDGGVSFYSLTQYNTTCTP